MYKLTVVELEIMKEVWSIPKGEVSYDDILLYTRNNLGINNIETHNILDKLVHTGFLKEDRCNFEVRYNYCLTADEYYNSINSDKNLYLIRFKWFRDFANYCGSRSISEENKNIAIKILEE